MKKIKLDLSELQVQSFETTPDFGSQRGTVRAYTSADPYDPYCRSEVGYCDDASAGGTCDGTCQYTCGCPPPQSPNCATFDPLGCTGNHFTDACHTAGNPYTTCIETCDGLTSCNLVCWSGPAQTCGASCGGGCPGPGITVGGCGTGMTGTCNGYDTCGHACGF